MCDNLTMLTLSCPSPSCREQYVIWHKKHELVAQTCKCAKCGSFVLTDMHSAITFERPFTTVVADRYQSKHHVTELRKLEWSPNL